MRTHAAFLTLIAELDGDVSELSRLRAQNERAWVRIRNGANDPIDWGALGYTLHALYGALENYFLRVSKFFENTLPGDAWHRSLVERMSLEVPGVRPALIDTDEARRDLVELMRFRHRFRNLYGEDLDPARTTAVQETASRILIRFPSIHDAFAQKVRLIAEGLE